MTSPCSRRDHTRRLKLRIFRYSDTSIGRSDRRDGRGIRIESEHADEIFEVAGHLLFQLRARKGFMRGILPGQENARGHREKLPVIFQDVRLFGEQILVLRLTIEILDALVVEAVGASAWNDRRAETRATARGPCRTPS